MKFALCCCLFLSSSAFGQAIGGLYSIYSERLHRQIDIRAFNFEAANGVVSFSSASRLQKASFESVYFLKKESTRVEFTNIVLADWRIARADLSIFLHDHHQIMIHPVSAEACEVTSDDPEFLLRGTERLNCFYDAGFFRPGMSGGN